MPDWYPLIRAARFLNVPPWELMQQPSYWMDWALDAEMAENEARREISSRTELQRGTRGNRSR